MLNSKTLEGKTVLITGCNRGIGYTVLELFAKEGANIIAVLRKDRPDFSAKLENISENYNINIRCLYCDLSDENSIKSSLSVLLKDKITVDVLVNNAGIATGGLLQMTSIAELRRVFQI